MRLALGSLIKQLKNIPRPTNPGEVLRVDIYPYIPALPTYIDGTGQCDATARAITLYAALNDGLLYWEIEL